MTNGNGVLAPKHAVLQSTYIRSVPIGIAKSYSRDSVGCSLSYDESANSSGWVHDEEDTHEKFPDEAENELEKEEDCGVSYAFKYTSEPTVHVLDQPVHMVKQNVSFDNESSSPKSAVRSGGSISDASSYVSETTDCDPFNSLLGKMPSEDEESSIDDDESQVYSGEEQEGRNDDDGDSEKENNQVMPSSSSTSAHLPFKPSTLVKPTELYQHQNQHNIENHDDSSPRAPLSPVPMKAQRWRTMAAAAAEKKSSARFRSEQSWRDISKSPGNV